MNMRYLKKPRLLYILMLLLVSCRTFYQHGKNDARWDIQENKIKLCRHGEYLRHEPEIAQIFLIQYNVEWFHFEKEDLTEDAMQHCDGYNVIMEAEIRNRFGKDIFKKVSRAAENLHAHRNKLIPTEIN